ncbi:MAG: ABC transporter ATP-binding protein [Coriobacteriia bacterium]|nr:ABC transporter ATP-binding protein [Coriobacteriia bacterium]
MDKVSFSVSKGDWCMLLGPNGAGKSTSVFALAKTVPYSGVIELNGKNIQDYKNTEYAQKIGFLSQKNLVAYDFSVAEIVSMGRYAHAEGMFKTLSNEDKSKVEEALEACGLQDLKDRSVQELSGGEVQRTFLAQVLAQDPEVLVLDEPTNNLDLVYQSQIFDLLKKWISAKDGTIISVVHDLALARFYGTSAVLLNNGKVASSGNVEEVLSDKNLNEVYKMDVKAYFKKLYTNF